MGIFLPRKTIMISEIKYTYVLSPEHSIPDVYPSKVLISIYMDTLKKIFITVVFIVARN